MTPDSYENLKTLSEYVVFNELRANLFVLAAFGPNHNLACPSVIIGNFKPVLLRIFLMALTEPTDAVIVEKMFYLYSGKLLINFKFDLQGFCQDNTGSEN